MLPDNVPIGVLHTQDVQALHGQFNVARSSVLSRLASSKAATKQACVVCSVPNVREHVHVCIALLGKPEVTQFHAPGRLAIQQCVIQLKIPALTQRHN